uniref:Uncharacterized protein n=1 Tax=Noctiluca scintillans TaxID=2966 RepID=A0A7S1A166_NOCSC
MDRLDRAPSMSRDAPLELAEGCAPATEMESQRSSCFLPLALTPKRHSFPDTSKDDRVMSKISFLHVELTHLQEQMLKEQTNRRRDKHEMWAAMARVRSDLELRRASSPSMESGTVSRDDIETLFGVPGGLRVPPQEEEEATKDVSNTDETRLSLFEVRCQHLDIKFEELLHQVGTLDIVVGQLEKRSHAIEEHLQDLQMQSVTATAVTERFAATEHSGQPPIQTPSFTSVATSDASSPTPGNFRRVGNLFGKTFLNSASRSALR